MTVVRGHHANGMTVRRIAEAADIRCPRTIARLINGGDSRGPAKSLLRSNFEKIMRVSFEAPSSDGRRKGAVTDVAGTRRRLQALCVIGFTQRFLASKFGLDQRAIHKWVDSGAHGARAFVLATTADEVRRVYREHADRRPEDFGIASYVAQKTRASSAKKGWAGPGCWDDDTIDDPDAFPEWTGRCGTRAGYSIHMRERIPLCPACREAYSVQRKQLREAIRNEESVEAA